MTADGSLTRQTARGWSFFKSSAAITLGLALARMLGLAFSLVLARLLSPDQYGEIQYSIALAGLCAIITQPFGQHVFAKLIGSYKDDVPAFERYIPQAWLTLAMLFLASFAISLPFLIALDRLNAGVIMIFIGFTVFYTYYGIARGYLDNGRLFAAYFGSNAVQIIVIVLLYVVFHIDATQPALLVYGSSYFLPLLLLQIFRPFPLKVRLTSPDWEILRSIARLSIPIFIAHAGFIAYMAVDLLFLERTVTGAELGVYALSKNLSAVFILVSMGVNTVIMPRIAGAPRSQHREILRQALTWHLVVSGSILVAYALLYNPVVSFVFGADYASTPAIYLVFAAAMVMSQTHSVISQALVGQGKSDLYATSMMISLVVTVVAAALLVPQYAGIGAASAMFIGAATAIALYGVVALRRLRQSASSDTV